MTFEEEQALISILNDDDALRAWESACERADAEKRAAEVARQFLQAEVTRLHGIVESYRALVSHVRALVNDE